MADPQYNFDSQPENDFEKISAPSEGFDHRENDGLNASGQSGVGEEPQDGEVSTTSNIQGEDEPEEDRYRSTSAAASEADAFASSLDPLISEEPPRAQDPWSQEPQPQIIQPSAPVPEPENIEPLIDLGISSDQGTLSASNDSSVPPFTSNLSSVVPEPIPASSKLLDFSAFEPQKNESESKQVTDSEKSSEPVETSKGGCLMKGLDPRVVELIYWRDPKKTGAVFGSMLVVLISLATFSLVSVLAYLSLAALTVTFSFVIYKKIMGAVQKSNDGHPFKSLLEKDITLNEDKLKSVIEALLNNLNKMGQELRRLFLVEDVVDSIKFGLLLWVFTYVGCLLNGMTLIILGLILLFTLPKVYETYQVPIDNYIGLAKAQIDNVLAIVKSKLPFLKKKDKAQ